MGATRTLRIPAFALAAMTLSPAAFAQKLPTGDEEDPAAAKPATPSPATPAATVPRAPAAAVTVPVPPAPASAPAATAAPASGAPGSTPQTTGVSYTVKLHDLERRVNELKEQIFRSKARLNLMKETVLHGQIGGSRAIITHRNEMSSSYTLIKLVYALDGAEIYAKADDNGHLTDTQELSVYEGSIVPGKHTVQVSMLYQGNGYGVFSYLKGYKAKVEKTCTFSADEGKATQIKVVAFEQGNAVTTDWEKRPATDCRLNVTTDKPDGTAPAQAKK